MIGNKLQKGVLLLWHPSEESMRRGIPVRVAGVIEPKVESISGEKQLTRLVLLLDIPIAPNSRGEETQLPDFVAIVDPGSQQIIERMVG